MLKRGTLVALVIIFGASLYQSVLAADSVAAQEMAEVAEVEEGSNPRVVFNEEQLTAAEVVLKALSPGAPPVECSWGADGCFCPGDRNSFCKYCGNAIQCKMRKLCIKSP